MQIFPLLLCVLYCTMKYITCSVYKLYKYWISVISCNASHVIILRILWPEKENAHFLTAFRKYFPHTQTQKTFHQFESSSGTSIPKYLWQQNWFISVTLFFFNKVQLCEVSIFYFYSVSLVDSLLQPFCFYLPIPPFLPQFVSLQLKVRKWFLLLGSAL